jgi:hypothetical protein
MECGSEDAALESVRDGGSEAAALQRGFGAALKRLHKLNEIPLFIIL